MFGCILNIFVMTLALLVVLGVASFALQTLAGLMGLAVTALMAWFTLYLAYRIVTFVVPGFFRNIANLFSWIFTETPGAVRGVIRSLKRAAGIDEASVVADFLSTYRTENEELFIGNPVDWAETLLDRMRRDKKTSDKKTKSASAAGTAAKAKDKAKSSGKSSGTSKSDKGLKNRIRKAIRARDLLLLQLRRRGDTERLEELVTGIAQTMQKLISLYLDLKPVVRELRNQKKTLEKLNSRIRKYETQILRESDPAVVKSLRSAIRSCLESIEVIRANRRKIKVFSIRIETATTKLENLAVMCLDTNETETTHVLDELDELTEEIASSRRAFSEALEEIDRRAGRKADDMIIDSSEDSGESRGKASSRRSRAEAPELEA